MPMMTSQTTLSNLQQQNQQNYQIHHQQHFRQQNSQQQNNYSPQHLNNNQQHFGINYGSSSTSTGIQNEGLMERQNNNNTWLPVPPGFSPRSSTGTGF